MVKSMRRDGERTFGSDAMAVAVKYPKNCYFYLLDLLGKKVDDPSVKLFRQRFPYYDIEADPERGTVVFKHDEDTRCLSLPNVCHLHRLHTCNILQECSGRTIFSLSF
jgi:hypoxia up-regulated 1